MKTVLTLVSAFYLLSSTSSSAITCYDIREKAKAKKGKASCVLIDHTVGISPGTTVSVYECGKTKYWLRKDASSTNTCTVSTKPN